MRLIFAGTPAVAVPTLRALHDAGHEIALVLTRTDAPRGRKRVLTPSEVAVAAEELGLPVLKANRVDDAVLAELQAAKAELGVVVAYGVLFDAQALAAPARGWINLHFSLLPAWRGAAPVQRNLLHGGPLGVTVFQLERGMDTGPVWASETLAVDPLATASEVLADFAERGIPSVIAALEHIAQGAVATPQTGEPSIAAKLSVTDGVLDPSQGMRAVFARFRAVTEEPGASIDLDGDRLKVLAARPSDQSLPVGELALVERRVLWGTGDGALELLRVQAPGKAAMPAADWWRGRR